MKNLIRFASLTCLVAFCFVALGAGQAAAQSTYKIGYTDHELIIAQMPEFQQIQTSLREFAQGGQSEYQRRATEFQAKLEDYQKKQAVMAEATRKSKEEELARIQGEIQSFLARKEQELAQRESELMQPVLDKVQGAIDDVAKEQGLDLVLSTRAGVTPILLYANEKTVLNVTDQVMRRLGMTPTASTTGGQ